MVNYESEFRKSLSKHIQSVQEAGRQIGVKESLLEVHDLSKWDEPEFSAYAKHFHGGGAPDEFAVAWLHHVHINPHHWQHWIFPDGFTPRGSNLENGVIEMPIDYVKEMVADWMGASMAYTGSYDMTDWLKANLHKVKVHSNTAKEVSQILTELGYQEDIAFLI